MLEFVKEIKITNLFERVLGSSIYPATSDFD